MPPKSKMQILGAPWQFVPLWNGAIECVPERPLIKREHIWASELGGSFIDRYLKMHATPMTNPPNARSRRKFLAGHIFEWIIKIVMVSTGILKQQQVRGEVELPGLLRVSGKNDFVAGGEMDWEKAHWEVQKMKELFATTYDDAPQIIAHAIEYVFEHMKSKFEKTPMMRLVFEGKSVSSFIFPRIQKCGAMPNHILQSGHYVIADTTNIPMAKIFYISKDDCLGEEFDVEPGPPLLKAYKNDVQKMTEYFRGAGKNHLKNMPPKEPEVIFDDVLFHFEKNLKVEYSSYLSMLYGYEDPEQYRLKWQKEVANWNRVFKRVVKNEKMTALNLEIIGRMKHNFPDFEKFVYKAKSEGAFQGVADDE